MGAAVNFAAQAATKILKSLEPWYIWGPITVERMEEIESGGERKAVGGEGDVFYLQVQWLGLHLGFQIGRTPKREG